MCVVPGPGRRMRTSCCGWPTCRRWRSSTMARRRFGWCETRSISKRPGRPLAEAGQGRASFQISASRGDGVPELIAALVGFAQSYFGGSEGGLIGRTRQRKLLQETAASLRRCIEVVGQGEELAAEELAHGGAFAGAAARAGRCRGHPRRDLPGVLRREVTFPYLALGPVSRETFGSSRTRVSRETAISSNFLLPGFPTPR